MTGNIATIITKLNKACDDMDFVSARVLIETNLVKLSEGKYYRLLNTNGQVLLKHILANSKNSQKGSNPLTRAELLIINRVNEYCTNFDIPMLKRTLKTSLELMQREEITPLLNSDAKIILHDMGALLGVNQLQ
ncbi:hypothetical protein [Lysinibacillus piscis]|uniref:Uncharacterized protein n=1 Tax=Lysinibacillus piscis TaxID=2518931 RepID=A0ABQ5NJ71_9BACI|nr:hypothetical protein [Lysinibacillus sp. KH24]GLC88420.1 hypothetical protein LYSBPC_15470 [Lysinibacillus sp. KH24]